MAMQATAAASRGATVPLVVHVIHRFALGGTEQGMVNLMNRMPAGAYRHAVVALTGIDEEFRARLSRSDVELVALRKPPGHGYKVYGRLYRLFRSMRPAIVHTRNLAALEAQLPAWAAGVPVRIHGEHGWDITDPGGTRRAMRWVRQLYRPFVSHYVAVSRDLARYLSSLGIAESRVAQIYNGVDTRAFHPPPAGRESIAGCPFGAGTEWLIGTVGRMQPIKDQLTLVRAFARTHELSPAQRGRLRLVLVGDGPLYAEAQAILAGASLARAAWMPGTREDVASILRGLDCFALPSRAEGVSNTILEAMASGLPIVATDVGGNAELVEAGVTGALVPSGDVDAMARCILAYARDPAAARAAGRAGRLRAERQFSLDTMVARHQELYDRLLRGAAPRVGHTGPFDSPA
jgi:sugar transferase (PEP-CTERM/EpsH1 system associated)